MTSTPPTATVYTHIERDTRNRWHPVIEIRKRGRQVFAATSLQGYWSAGEAAKAGREVQELLRSGQ